MIQKDRRRAIEALLRHYRQYHRHAVLTPSGRFGLYAAAREMLSPGDAVIISPITCRSVVQALLAANVRPVFTDIELETGNIDIRKLDAGLLSYTRAIVTTNLYGNPDRTPEIAKLARAHNLLLIEDCAHVLETHIGGRAIGSIGDVSVFSFKKYFDEPGGVIALRNEEAARKVQARVAAESEIPPRAEEHRRYAQFVLARAATPAILRPLSSMCRRWRSTASPSAAPPSEGSAAPTQVGRKQLPVTASLLRAAALLRNRERLVADRMAATADLIARCPLPVKRSCYADRVCHLVVPFYAQRRDAIVTAMNEKGIPTYFRYTPPMNEVFATQATSAHVNPEVIEHWCRNILPVDVRFGSQYLEVIQTLQ